MCPVVDEAHRMSAHYSSWSGEVAETKRFKLGRLLSETAHHLLLMTATLCPSACAICGCVSAACTTNPRRVRASSSHSAPSMPSATAAMKARMAAKGVQMAVWQTVALAAPATHCSSGRPSRPLLYVWFFS